MLGALFYTISAIPNLFPLEVTLTLVISHTFPFLINSVLQVPLISDMYDVLYSCMRILMKSSTYEATFRQYIQKKTILRLDFIQYIKWII
jgi:hypothetical protein